MAAAADNITSPTRVWLFYLIFAVTFFIFQEMLLRFVFPVPEIANFNRVNYSMLFQDVPDGSVQPLSNAAFTWEIGRAADLNPCPSKMVMIWS